MDGEVEKIVGGVSRRNVRGDSVRGRRQEGAGREEGSGRRRKVAGYEMEEEESEEEEEEKDRVGPVRRDKRVPTKEDERPSSECKYRRNGCRK